MVPAGSGKLNGCNARAKNLVDLLINCTIAPGICNDCFVRHISHRIVFPAASAFLALFRIRVRSFRVPPAPVRRRTCAWGTDIWRADYAAGAVPNASLGYHTFLLLVWPIAAVGSQCFGVRRAGINNHVLFSKRRVPELMLHPAGSPWVDSFDLRLHHINQGDDDCGEDISGHTVPQQLT